MTRASPENFQGVGVPEVMADVLAGTHQTSTTTVTANPPAPTI
ncbi:MAG TPA: hypothetical protein VNC61_06760 [Acidimicrobiales bacterium]|nr:hypothetical protein [Acidimicrobiales bacterium]